MARTAESLGLHKVDDIFSTQQQREEQQRETIKEIPLTELYPNEQNPFKVRNDEEMQDMIESGLAPNPCTRTNVSQNMLN